MHTLQAPLMHQLPTVQTSLSMLTMLQQLLLQQHAHQLQQQAVLLATSANASQNASQNVTQNLTSPLSINIPQTTQLPPIQIGLSSSTPNTNSILTSQNSPLATAALAVLSSPPQSLNTHQQQQHQNTHRNVVNSPISASSSSGNSKDVNMATQANDTCALKHSVAFPHRAIDMFCIRTLRDTGVECDACVGDKARPLCLVGALVHNQGDVVEGEPYNSGSGQTGSVVSVRVVEWFCEMCADSEPVLWVLGDKAWYRLLRPAVQYAHVHATFVDRVRCGEAISSMVSQDPQTSVYSIIQQVKHLMSPVLVVLVSVYTLCMFTQLYM
jgi:hypothetical protein